MWQACVFSFYQQFECPKINKNWQKNVNFGSDTHISDVKMNPFNTFGPDVFTYLKLVCVQIKENITGKTASGF